MRQRATPSGAHDEVFRTVWEHSADAMALSDSNGIVTMANPAYYQLYGFSPEEVLGHSFALIFPPEQQESAVEQYRAIFASDTPPPTFESIVRKADGTERVVESRIEFIESSGQRTAMLSTIRDITERKQIELRLRQESETIQSINQVGQLLSAELDPQKLVQAFTDAATRLSGAAFGAFFYNLVDERGESYTLYTLSGAPHESFAGFPMPRNTHIFERTFRGERAVRLDDVTADPLYGRNPPHHGTPLGHLPVRSYLAVPVISRTGEVLGGLFFGHPNVGVFNEHSERTIVALAAQAGIAMENAHLYQQAQAAIRLRDQFLSIASHELKTPLTVLLGNSQMLERRAANNPNMQDRERRAIRVIVDQARRLSTMISGLLDISRIEMGQLSIRRTPLDLGQLALRVVEEIQPSLERHSIEVSVGPEALTVAGDALRLEQVLQNLIGNAIKYSPTGGTVTVGVEKRADQACLSVSDQGIGIPQAALEHLFNRFYRADNVDPDRISGVGIGLFVVKEIVTLHGGSVSVESVEGQGSCFTICLPLAAF
jgi:PAS domain S-box-containing protein